MPKNPDNLRAVLIVDQDPNLSWFISKLCKPGQHEILSASSGQEALKVIEERGGSLEAVLVEPQMPGMGGLEVLKSIRHRYPDLPVLVLTALQDQKNACEKLGVEVFLRKPYHFEELQRHMERILGRRAAGPDSQEIPAGYEASAKILIVDDETEVCELLAANLSEDVRDADFKVDWVRTGDEALRISLEFEPDIAIIDMKMPHMWGDELVRRFKAGEGHAPRDFIIYTSVADPAQMASIQKLGCECFTKPAHLEVLVEALKRICARHRLIKKKKN